MATEMNKKLVLENGMEFPGCGFGADCDRVCQLVFNTSMVGYQEIVTDPGYADQMVMMTYPIPMLILQGELDFQATAAVDFAGYKALLGDRDNVTFKLYPGLNHALVPALSGSILKAKQEYNTERHIGPNVLDDIAAWIRAN